MVDLDTCPNVTRDMIRVVLNKLKAENRIVCEGAGAGCGLDGNVGNQLTGYLK